ncbi:hypothetical protein AKO1_006420 [Acrasis kona]|uniref:Gustatory receptor n=1 Tax=Acrasis kona TaxID=1008807 RepID=A0AAW2YJ02_9EUKA
MISGLDFQYNSGYAKRKGTIIVIELSSPLVTSCPTYMKNNFYFLECSKQDCEKYFDKIMLQSDDRLLKLAIQSLPSWAVFVNRYSVPIYYSHRFRIFITTLVNIYIVISLIWGFYDLYKNLPIVGGAFRRVVGPIVSALEPMLRNRIVLLIPLLFSRLYATYENLIQPIISTLFYPVFQVLINILLPACQYVSGVCSRMYQASYPLLCLLKSGGQVVMEFASGVGWMLWSLLKAPVDLLMMINDFLYVHIQMFIQFLSVLLGFVVAFFKFFVYPIQKLAFLFGAVSEHKDTVKATVQTATTISEFKGLLDQIKSNYLTPISSLWAGIRRIIDSIIHTYNTKIRHHDVLLRRLLIAILCVSVVAALLLVFFLL